MLRLWHLITGHRGTWIESQHGVLHHVCPCGHAEPAERVTCRNLKAREAYDFDRAVRSNARANLHEIERRRMATRRSGYHAKPTGFITRMK